MLVAFINGIVGLALTFGIGLSRLHYTIGEVFSCILATQIGGLISPLVTLQLEQVPWIRQNVLNRSFKTWTFFVGLYFVISILICAELRSVRAWLWLFVPLVLTNGFTIFAVGPIQDWVVRRRQRRAGLATSKTK